MRYYKIVEGEYIVSIGTGRTGGEEITKEEYESILSVVTNQPESHKDFFCKLKTDLTWELYELPPVDENRELSDSEALEIILGGSV